MLADPRQIAAYAQQYGLDPAYANAVASRESSFNPNAHASKSIYGLFQMSGPLRQKYGVPLGSDVQTQVRGFATFTNDLKQQMTSALGRPPTNAELYLGHYWGPQRAAGIISGHYANMPARDVFSAKELAGNPNIAPDKPVGQVAQGIMRDMQRRSARYGANSPATTDQPQPMNEMVAQAQPQQSAAPDLAQYGVPDTASDSTAPTTTAPAPTPAPMPDLAKYGAPASAADATTPDTSTMDTISALASQDSGGFGDLGSSLADIGKGMGGGSSTPAPPPLPVTNPDADYLESAMLQRQMGPVGGVSSLPGQPAQGNSMLPGGTSPTPGFNPAMFGVAPNQQQQPQQA